MKKSIILLVLCLFIGTATIKSKVRKKTVSKPKTEASTKGIKHTTSHNATESGEIQLVSHPKDLKFTVNGVKFTMVYVEGGSFIMGSDICNDQAAIPVHRDSVSSFYIGQTEVTQELYEAVMGPLNIENQFLKGKKLPIIANFVNFREFIGRLNDLTDMNFRLPSSEEWEFAARGGVESKGYHFYAGSNDPDEVAWYNTETPATGGKIEPTATTRPRPVATKKPNELGLYDMTGNVSEFTSSYDSESIQYRKRVYRGGAWTWRVWDIATWGSNYGSINYNIGYRLALSVDKTTDSQQ